MITLTVPAFAGLVVVLLLLGGTLATADATTSAEAAGPSPRWTTTAPGPRATTRRRSPSTRTSTRREVAHV